MKIFTQVCCVMFLISLLSSAAIIPGKTIEEETIDEIPDALDKKDVAAPLTPPTQNAYAINFIHIGGKNFTMNDVINSILYPEKNGTRIPDDLILSPKNLSYLYKGKWKSFFPNGDSEAVNISLTKGEGDVLFEMATRETGLDGAHAVIGDMVLRDGIYTSGSSMRLLLHGFHFWRSGLVLLRIDDISRAEMLKVLADFNEARYWDKNTTLTAVHSLIHNLNIPLGSPFGGCSFSSAMNAVTQESAPEKVEELEKSGGNSISDPSYLFDNAESEDDNTPVIRMFGFMSSIKCGIGFSFDVVSTPLLKMLRKTSLYLIFACSCTIAQIVLMMRQVRLSTSQAQSFKISMLTIGQQAILDSYLTLAHLMIGFGIKQLINYSATTSFLEFILFSVIEMRLILMIWKARRQAFFDQGMAAVRRELTQMYIRFYAAMIASIILIYQLTTDTLPYFIVFMYSFWIPQIVHNATRGTKRPFTLEYIVGTSFCRLLIPLYFVGCPYNFLHLEPRPGFSVFLVFYMGALASVLILQDKYGPRFFVPKRFLPPVYDYHRPLPPDFAQQQGEITATPPPLTDGNGNATEMRELNHRTNGTPPVTPPHRGNIQSPSEAPMWDLESGNMVHITCSVCMADIDPTVREQYMLTPCNHLFHADCLMRWLDIKLECPICRSSLEAPE